MSFSSTPYAAEPSPVPRDAVAAEDQAVRVHQRRAEQVARDLVVLEPRVAREYIECSP